MGMLTFTAQLSLDFLFGGVKKLPNSGEEVLSSSFSIQLGGGTLVYPIVLTRLGVDCRVIVKESDSVQSKLAYSLLHESGIKEIVTNPADFDPVMSTAVISQQRDRSFVSYNDPRAFVFDDEFLFTNLRSSKVVFATEQNISLIPRLKREGCIIVFDVGWSEDLSVEKYRPILQYVDYFTPNDKEAMKMTGTASVPESLLALQNYVKHPIVSCGKDGCMTMQDGSLLHVPAPRGINTVDTTGAGDNFMAGLIYAINRDMSITDCLKFANGTGSLSTTALGCYGAAYTLRDVQELLRAYENMDRENIVHG